MTKFYLSKGIAMLMLLFFSISAKAQVEFKPVPKPDTVKLKKAKTPTENLKTTVAGSKAKTKSKKTQIEKVIKKRRTSQLNLYWIKVVDSPYMIRVFRNKQTFYCLA